jgi:hypothetical protein
MILELRLNPAILNFDKQGIPSKKISKNFRIKLAMIAVSFLEDQVLNMG